MTNLHDRNTSQCSPHKLAFSSPNPSLSCLGISSLIWMLGCATPPSDKNWLRIGATTKEEVIKHYGEPRPGADVCRGRDRTLSSNYPAKSGAYRRYSYDPTRPLRNHSYQIEPDRAWPCCKRRVGRHRRTAAEGNADSLRLVRHRARSTRVKQIPVRRFESMWRPSPRQSLKFQSTEPVTCPDS